MVDNLEKNAIDKALKKTLLLRASILDVPCGTGRITKYLLEKGCSVIGADISTEMLRYAKKKLDRFHNLQCLVRTDAEQMGFKDDGFDCVTTVRLMGHIPPHIRVAILREMARVTNRYIIVFYYSSDIISNLKRKIKNIVKRNRSPWFPARKCELLAEISAANLELLMSIPVFSIVSESRVLLLKKREKPR